ncbi:MAG TPA: hypothetical protein PLW81_06125 [Thiobacillaceae bacterium]|nr:hypothetical protein [Thiobacillaceae bacterium]
MNLIASLFLTVGLGQPVVLPGCCPAVTWVAVRVVPVVLVARAMPATAPQPEPMVRDQGAATHVARI